MPQPIPHNLFSPGNGTHPALFVGRRREENFLRDYTGRLDDLDDKGRANVPANIVLYGPRGNGKTVLLGRFREWAEAQSKWRILDLRGNLDVQDSNELAQFVVPAPMRKRFMASLSKAELSMTEPGGTRYGVVLPAMAEGRWSLDQALLAVTDKSPCLMLIDEAHLLPAQTLAHLLLASERLRNNGAPFLLVLSGTPVLEDVLLSTGVSNWDRAELLPLGRLPLKASLRALTEPLKKHGVEFEDAEALAAAERSMQDYAFFTQVYGQAVVDGLNAAGSRRFDLNAVAHIRPRFHEKRDNFYRARRTEVRRLDCQIAAAAAWGCLVGHGPDAPEALLLNSIERFRPSQMSVNEAYNHLRRLGVLWPVRNGMEVGIPSLMDSIVKLGGAETRTAYEQGKAMGRDWRTA